LDDGNSVIADVIRTLVYDLMRGFDKKMGHEICKATKNFRNN